MARRRQRQRLSHPPDKEKITCASNNHGSNIAPQKAHAKANTSPENPLTTNTSQEKICTDQTTTTQAAHSPPTLTPWNTRYQHSVQPTHSPRLPYPFETNRNDWVGFIDTSQCILKEPSIITEEDLIKARQHLQKHLAYELHNTLSKPHTKKITDHPPKRKCTQAQPT